MLFTHHNVFSTCIIFPLYYILRAWAGLWVRACLCSYAFHLWMVLISCFDSRFTFDAENTPCIPLSWIKAAHTKGSRSQEYMCSRNNIELNGIWIDRFFMSECVLLDATSLASIFLDSFLTWIESHFGLFAAEQVYFGGIFSIYCRDMEAVKEKCVYINIYTSRTSIYQNIFGSMRYLSHQATNFTSTFLSLLHLAECH